MLFSFASILNHKTTAPLKRSSYSLWTIVDTWGFKHVSTHLHNAHSPHIPSFLSFVHGMIFPSTPHARKYARTNLGISVPPYVGKQQISTSIYLHYQYYYIAWGKTYSSYCYSGLPSRDVHFSFLRWEPSRSKKKLLSGFVKGAIGYRFWNKHPCINRTEVTSIW